MSSFLRSFCAHFCVQGHTVPAQCVLSCLLRQDADDDHIIPVFPLLRSLADSVNKDQSVGLSDFWNKIGRQHLNISGSAMVAI